MFKRLFLEYWHLQCYLLLLCFKIAHGAHSLNQDPTGLGGHEVWVHNPFLEGSLSILGCDSAPGWSVQKGRAAGATESMVPRAGGLEHKGQTGPGARQPHWPHYSISCHLVNIFSLSTFFFFFPSPKSPDSLPMETSKIQTIVSSCFPLYIFCAIFKTHNSLPHIPHFLHCFSSSCPPPHTIEQNPGIAQWKCTLMHTLSWAICSWASVAWLRDRERGYWVYLSP